MTPIEELTALEQAEVHRTKQLVADRHAAELGVVTSPIIRIVPVPLVVPVATDAPKPVTPVATPTATTGKPDLTPSFLRHLVDEVKAELTKEGE